MVRFGLGTVVGFGAAPRAAVGLAADVGVYFPVAWLPFDLVSFAMGVRRDPPAAGYGLGGVRVSLLGPYYGIHDMGEPDENLAFQRALPNPRSP